MRATTAILLALLGLGLVADVFADGEKEVEAKKAPVKCVVESCGG